MASDRAVSLRKGDVELGLLPHIGGAVSRLTWQGEHVLRPTPSDATNPLQTSSFALVPYSNRIAHGRFRFNGDEIRLAPNHGDHPHWLHGHGWLRPWQVASVAGDSATLTFAHEPGEWPWAYFAEQIFTLTDNGARIDLTVTNRSSRPMPVSLGFHPYFQKTPATTIRAPVTDMWDIDDTILPAHPAPATSLVDLGAGAVLSRAPFIDHCFPGLHGAVQIDTPERGLSIAMTASDACRFFHLYNPASDFFCAEPVTAMPDMVNRPEPAEVTGVRTLGGGESFSIWMQLAASAP